MWMQANDMTGQAANPFQQMQQAAQWREQQQTQPQGGLGGYRRMPWGGGYGQRGMGGYGRMPMWGGAGQGMGGYGGPMPNSALLAAALGQRGMGGYRFGNAGMGGQGMNALNNSYDSQTMGVASPAQSTNALNTTYDYQTMGSAPVNALNNTYDYQTMAAALPASNDNGVSAVVSPEYWMY